MADNPDRETLKDKFRGCLFGLAIGDAIGTTLEFKNPGTFERINDMVGGGPFNLVKGQWTDDTSMALCLAESLIENNDYNANDQTDRYIKWYREGHFSPTGRCFDIGITTRKALKSYEEAQALPEAERKQYYGQEDEQSSGNGSLMRLAPITMFYYGKNGDNNQNKADAVFRAGESSKTTHNTKIAIDICMFFSGLLIGAFEGRPKEHLLSPNFCPFQNGDWGIEFHPEVQQLIDGNYKNMQPPQIKASGFAPKTLEAALWAFYHTRTFDEGMLMCVNLGDDADTVGAIYGQIAGAYYGYEKIKKNWKRTVIYSTLLEGVSDRLCYPLDQDMVARCDALLNYLRRLEEYKEDITIQQRETACNETLIQLNLTNTNTKKLQKDFLNLFVDFSLRFRRGNPDLTIMEKLQHYFFRRMRS